MRDEFIKLMWATRAGARLGVQPRAPTIYEGVPVLSAPDFCWNHVIAKNFVLLSTVLQCYN